MTIAQPICRMSRVWAMPNLDTLQVPEIALWVRGYLMRSKVSADPFARNCRLATWRNDLNPETAAEHHMDSADFLEMLRRESVQPDCVILDPPYSQHQIKVSYSQIGRAQTVEDGWRVGRWTKEKDIISEIQPIGGIVLQLGWNSAGMGEKRGYELIDVLIVCHGPGHNDTICIAERKVEPEASLF